MRLTERTKLALMDIESGATAFQTNTNSVNMKLYNRVRITLILLQSGAGTATVTLKQGTADSAATALAFDHYFKNETGVTTDALTRVNATTLTTAGPTTGLNVYVFEVKADMLNTDTAGSENVWARMDVASLANNDVALILYEGYEPRQALGPEDMPTMIA